MPSREEVKGIISSSATTAAAASGALSQVPGSDIALIAPIVAQMVVSLGKLFNEDIDKERAVLVVRRMMEGAGVAWFPKLVAGSLVLGFIPFVGNVARGGVAAYFVRAAGWAIFAALKEGRDLSAIEPNEWQSYFKSV